MQSMQVLHSHPQKHDQIIQIDQTVDEIQLTHTILHKLLESSWCVTKSKRHSIAPKESQITHGEGGVLLQCLIHLYLPKSGFQIQARKVTGAY